MKSKLNKPSHLNRKQHNNISNIHIMEKIPTQYQKRKETIFRSLFLFYQVLPPPGIPGMPWLGFAAWGLKFPIL